MDVLRDVKSWMNFLGWEGGGAPGSVKRSADGAIIAKHGDATWIEDVDHSCKQIERERIVAELEERDRTNAIGHLRRSVPTE